MPRELAYVGKVRVWLDPAWLVGGEYPLSPSQAKRLEAVAGLPPDAFVDYGPDGVYIRAEVVSWDGREMK